MSNIIFIRRKKIVKKLFFWPTVANAIGPKLFNVLFKSLWFKILKKVCLKSVKNGQFLVKVLKNCTMGRNIKITFTEFFEKYLGPQVDHHFFRLFKSLETQLKKLLENYQEKDLKLFIF